MKTGIKILLVLVFILILDLISTTIAMTAVPTWNVFMVFGIFFVVIAIITSFAFIWYID